jgi:hypothetical protein
MGALVEVGASVLVGCDVAVGASVGAAVVCVGNGAFATGCDGAVDAVGATVADVFAAVGVASDDMPREAGCATHALINNAKQPMTLERRYWLGMI